ncbi:MAG: 4Fe-4S dicluster domain-containing protein [Thermoguttaceae bacterium]|jgi:ferredoxin
MTSRRVATIIAWTLRLGLFALLLALLIYGSTEIGRSILLLSPLYFLSVFIEDLKSTNFVRASELVFILSSALSFLIIILCSFKRRFFCRYFCPIGLCVDLATKLRHKVFKSPFLRHGLRLPSRYFFTFFAVFWLVISTPLFLPNGKTAGFTALAFDPMSLLSQTIALSPKVGPIVLALILCFIVSPYFWRFRFCPCGALQELFFIPKRLIRKIMNKERRRKEFQPRVKLRRTFFRTCGIAAVSVAFAEMLKHMGLSIRAIFIRPPGAAQEREFLSRCGRCGQCVMACPNSILTLVDFSEEQANKTQTASGSGAVVPNLAKAVLRNTPRVDFSLGEQFCEKDCDACGQACPTGAIVPLTPEEKLKKPIAIARFELERCMLYYDRECSICRRECPYEAIDFVWSEEEYLNLPIIDPERCVGCGQCVVKCPGEPLIRAFGEYDDPGSDNRVKALSIILRS